MNVCLSKWEREGASWCLLWILQKLPRNFSDTSRGQGWPDGCPLVGCRQGGVHESHCEEDGECERHDDQRATELHSAAPSPRHVTSRVTRTAVTTPATRPPRDTGPVTDKWLGLIEPIIHLHIFTPLHLQNSYLQTMSNVVMVFWYETPKPTLIKINFEQPAIAKKWE